MSTPTEDVGNVVQPANKANDRYKMLKELKLKYDVYKNSTEAGHAAKAADILKIICHETEVERIRMIILQKLYNISELSPEFSQLSGLTGTTDRLQMAEILAQKQYAKEAGEIILSQYTADKNAVQKHFLEGQTETVAQRLGSLNARQTAAGGTASALPKIAKALGFSALVGTP